MNETKIIQPIKPKTIIKIDRSISIIPEIFIDEGWSIDEQDERCLVLTEIDLSKIILKTILEEKEKSIRGENRLKRLKRRNFIRLDADVFKTFWKNQHLIPEEWKEKTNGKITFIHFDGTILRRYCGRRCVLYLCWYVNRWHRDYGWLGSDFSANDLSAVLEVG